MTQNPKSPAAVTCIVPVYNEAGAVAETLSGLAELLAASGRSWELILVDDGSTDGTMDAARAADVEFQGLKHETNRGYGAAIKTGLRHAEHPWILIIDADGTYPTAEVGKLLAALDTEPGADMIVGRRTQTLETDGFFRLVGKGILTRLADFLAERSIPDLNSGLRLMRREAMERYRPLLPDGFSLTTSITLALLCSGAHVSYVAIDYRPRKGESKIRPVRDMWNFVMLILRTMTYFNPLKVFLPMAALLIVAAFATVIVSKLIAGEVMDVTALFLFIAGLQMLLIGVVADLILKLAGTKKE